MPRLWNLLPSEIREIYILMTVVTVTDLRLRSNSIMPISCWRYLILKAHVPGLLSTDVLTAGYKYFMS